jgi:hypothetical protein
MNRIKRSFRDEAATAEGAATVIMIGKAASPGKAGAGEYTVTLFYGQLGTLPIALLQS